MTTCMPLAVLFRATAANCSAPPKMSRAISECLLLAVICMLILPERLVARDKSDPQLTAVRSDPAYLTATGNGSSVEQAREQAEKALASQIQIAVNVSSEHRSDYTEDNAGLQVNSEYVTRHRSYTGMLFKGLRYFESQDGELWTVTTCIHRDSLARSFDFQKNRIISLVSAGLDAVRKGSVGDGLTNLHQAWLLAQFYPDTINLSRFDASLPPYPKVALAETIRSILGRIEISASDCYRDGPLTMAPLLFSFEAKPIQDLSISYYGGAGMEYARVRNGRTDIPIGGSPSSSEQRLLITIEFTDAPGIESDNELAGLFEIFGSGEFPNLKNVVLHFPWVGDSIKTTPVVAEFYAPVSKTDDVADTPDSTLAEPWREFSAQRTTDLFLDMLVQYAKLGVVSYGRRADFGDGAGCYVAVFDDREVAALLYFDGEQFRSLDRRTVYNDLASSFRGRRQVWIREVKP